MLGSSNSHPECNGVCCDSIDYAFTPDGWSKVFLGNVIIAGLLAANVLYTVIQLYRSYAKLGRRIRRDLDRAIPMLSFYYIYALFASLWFILEAIDLILPQGSIFSIAGHVFYTGHALLDNAVIVFMFFKRQNRNALKWTLGISLLITSAKAVTVISYAYGTSDCAWCPLFFPAPTALVFYLVFACGYLLVIVSHFSLARWKAEIDSSEYFWWLLIFSSRPNHLLWTVFLFFVNSGFSIGSILVLGDVDSGYCLISAMVYGYTALYAPLLFQTFIWDSKYVHFERLGETEALVAPINFGGLSPSTGSGFTEDRILKKRIRNANENIRLIAYSELHIGKKIGVGGYGEVYKGQWKGATVAVKRFLEDKSDVEGFIKEIGMMAKLVHPNIVPFIGVVVEPDKRCLVTHFMQRGSVYGVIHNPKAIVTQKQMRRIALHAAKGMCYLHSRSPPILHRDLKSMNLLIDNDWNVKICDFGLSRVKIETATMSRIGTIQWVAPEILRDEPYNEMCDVYSFGVILWELLTLRVPYEAKGAFMIANGVAFKGLRLEIPSNCDPDIRKLMENCWQEAPNERPTFSQVVRRIKHTSEEQWPEKREGEGEVKSTAVPNQ